MEKYSLFGELLYIGFVCEKGRCKSSGLWKWRYRKVLQKHITILNKMISCILVNQVTDNDKLVLQEFIELIQNEREIGKYYPIDMDTIKQLQKCNYSILDSVNPYKDINSINLLMNDLTSEILELLKGGIFIKKRKIAMLIRAIHNLPRVYLGNNTKTLCNIDQPATELKDAIEYSFNNMDEATKQRYIQYFDNNNNIHDFRGFN